jgi:fibronectin-binding autotransporter adhesin
LLLPLSAGAATLNWDGSSSDDWATGANWSGDSAPANGDTVTIDSAINNPVTVTSSTNSPASLTIGSNAAQDALNINSGGILNMGGNISNAKTITINGGGTLNNDSGSTLTIGNNGNLILAGGSIKGSAFSANVNDLSGYGDISAPFTNNSTVTASGGILKVSNTFGTMSLIVASGATFDNNTGGSLGQFSAIMQGGTLAASNGTYSFTGGPWHLTGYGYITAPVSTSHGITASGGTLQITGDVSGPPLTAILGTGGSGDILDLRSSITSIRVNPGDGEVDLNGATLKNLTLEAGTVKLTGDSNFSGTINSSASIDTKAKTLSMSGATLNLNGGSLTNTGTIDIGGGTLNNATGSTLNIGGTGNLTLAGGSITGSGFGPSANNISGYGVLSAGPNSFFNTITASGGTLKMSNPFGTLGLTVASGATFDNATGGAIDFGGSTIHMQGGTLAASSGTYGGQFPITGYGYVTAPVATTRTITASGGTLQFTGNVTGGGINTEMNTGGGSKDILDLRSTITHIKVRPAGGEVDLNGATLRNVDLRSGLVKITGMGATTELTGLYDVGPDKTNLELASGGSLKVDSGSTLKLTNITNSITGGNIYVNGTLNNNTGSSLNLTSAGVTLGGGTLSGSAFSGDNISGYGTISAPLTTTGTFTLSGGSSNVSGMLTNQSTGLTNVQSTAAGTTFGDVTNAGTVNINANSSFGNVTNDGMWKVHQAAVTYGSFTNNGTYSSDPSIQTFANLAVGANSAIQAATGDKYAIKGNFTTTGTPSASSWNTAGATLQFIKSDAGSTSHILALLGVDYGQDYKGYTNNFAWGTLDLTGQTLTLVGPDNKTTTPGAIYVEEIEGLVFGGSNGLTITNITTSAGLNVYYDPTVDTDLGGKTYQFEGGGNLCATPLPASWLLMATGFLGLAGWRRFRKN